MTEYETLLENAESENVTVIENYDLSNTRFKGLYCDNVVALDKSINTQTEKACVLAEELGHYYTTVGNILDQNITENRKQEYRARMIAYNKMVGLTGIVNAYNAGCHNRYEIADYLCVTEEFLVETLQHYRSKYGLYVQLDNYMIYFEPLGVLKLYE